MDDWEAVMAREFILTMTAANRVGILSAVTRAMAELGGDLRELSQTVVRGYFTMIFSAEFPDTLTGAVIRDHIQDTCRPFGIDVGVKDPAQEIQADVSGEVRAVHTLRIGGENRPGVLRSLSTAISVQRIDIVGMRAVRVGEHNFEMVIRIAVPTEFDLPGLQRELESSSEGMSLTVDLKSDT